MDRRDGEGEWAQGEQHVACLYSPFRGGVSRSRSLQKECTHVSIVPYFPHQAL